MKLIQSKVTAVILTLLAAVMIASPNAEAQFLKSLSKKLEKVNKKLEQVNETLDNLSKGVTPGDNSSDSNSSATTADNKESANSGESNVDSMIDDSDWVEAEPIYNTPFITSNTKFMQIDDYDEFSSVNDGVFATPDCKNTIINR